MKSLLLAAALTWIGCSTPDSSALYRPSEAEPVRSETPAMASPDNPPGVDSPGPGAAGGSTTGARPPVIVSPVSTVTDAGLLEPVLPAPSDAAGDAGPAGAAPDAGSEPPPPPVEPLPPAEPPPPVEPACGGVLLGGVCWYLGELDQTCNAVCATRGGFAAASIASIGTPDQGGSLAACAAVLQALGEPALPMEGFRDDALGFGCHVFVDLAGDTSAWWLTAPVFAPTVSDPSARLACGCAR